MPDRVFIIDPTGNAYEVREGEVSVGRKHSDENEDNFEASGLARLPLSTPDEAECRAAWLRVSQKHCVVSKASGAPKPTSPEDMERTLEVEPDDPSLMGTATYKSHVLLVRDNGSKNGTYVNNVPVVGEKTLKKGDVLKLGTFELIVCVERAQA